MKAFRQLVRQRANKEIVKRTHYVHTECIVKYANTFGDDLLPRRDLVHFSPCVRILLSVRLSVGT